ncbi:hypothetical protein BZA70DRAFT_283263 [Myxozyma melibiosi]|uniref:Proline-rich protein HUA1 n=1 Tax=Myxozyma melibiosi TaxID=54550 RepID=A0ABR1F096_9ASCO
MTTASRPRPPPAVDANGIPSEAPPPYTLTPDGETSFPINYTGSLLPAQPQAPPRPPRPTNTNANVNANAHANAARISGSNSARTSSGRPSSSRPSTYPGTSASRLSNSTPTAYPSTASRPQNAAPPRPPRPTTKPTPGYHNGTSGINRPPPPPTASRPQRSSSSSNSNYIPAAGGRLMYPRGFHCYKCNNTGYKLKNGHPCRTCFESFGVSHIPPNLNIQYLPPVTYDPWYGPPASPTVYSTGGPARVVAPGDPSLGGILCGACKGRGYVNDLGFGNFLGEMLGGDYETCRVCKGVGRVF